jgi:hypothetical protein
MSDRQQEKEEESEKVGEWSSQRRENDEGGNSDREAEWTYSLEDIEETESGEQKQPEQSLSDRIRRRTRREWTHRWKPAMGRNVKKTVAVAILGVLMWGAGKLIGLRYNETIREIVRATQPATYTEAYLTTFAAVGASIAVTAIAAFVTMWIGMMVIFSDVRGERSIPRLIWERPWTLAVMFIGWLTAYYAVLVGLMIPVGLMTGEYGIVQAVMFMGGMLVLEYVAVWMVDHEYRSLYQTSNPAVSNT